MKTNDIKNIKSDFNLFLEKIKNNQNSLFRCKIIEESKDKYLGFKFMSILMNEEKSSKFIRVSDNVELKDKEITFETRDIKMRILNGTFYFLIEKYNLKKNIINNKYEKNIKLSECLFDSIKIYKSIDQIEKKENHLCSFILKTKEVIDKLKKFEFRDLRGKLYQVEESIFNNKFENGKIYYFSGFLYNIKSNTFEWTIISDIQEYSIKCEKIYTSNEIFESKLESLVNFKGKVISFSISKQYINVENNENKKFKVNVDFKLLKKISTSNECMFFNFFKIKNDEFSFSSFSDIETEEETILEFNFIDFDKIKDKYYNNIKIDNNYYPINNNKIIIKLSNTNKLNIFLQEIFYIKLDKEIIIDSFKFCVELNKGKILHINSLLGKDGFCYQFHVQSNKEEDLPNKIPITINNNNDIIYLENPDKNNNKLKEMFTIINVQEQNVKNIFSISNNDKIDNKINNTYDWKYMITINKEKEKDLKKFEKIEVSDKKKKFSISEDIQILMQKIINIFKSNSIEEPFKNIDFTNLNLVNNEILKILDGFNEFEFENNEKDYEIVKNIVLMILYSYSEEMEYYFYIYFQNYNEILKLIINLEYIDRIKILISFILRVLDNINFKGKYENLINAYDHLKLINIDEEETYINYPYVKKAFDIFYNIIDNLTEESLFYQAILQFNSKIYKEVKTGENLHSGTILNLNDIKLELIKNINRFLFLSEKNPKNLEDFAIFDNKSLLVIINLYSFFNSRYDIKRTEKYDNATCIILFLLFHECLGHQKKNINNEKVITPRRHYDSNFKDIIQDKADTGIALEKILFGEIVDLKSLMESGNLEKLLEPNLYIGKDFNNLRNIYNMIEKKSNYEDEKEESKSAKENNKKKEKIHHDKEDKKNSNKLLHDLFKIYSNVSDKEKESLKDDENYKRFLMLYEKKKKPSSYILPRFMRNFNKKI